MKPQLTAGEWLASGGAESEGVGTEQLAVMRARLASAVERHRAEMNKLIERQCAVLIQDFEESFPGLSDQKACLTPQVPGCAPQGGISPASDPRDRIPSPETTFSTPQQPTTTRQWMHLQAASSKRSFQSTIFDPCPWAWTHADDERLQRRIRILDVSAGIAILLNLGVLFTQLQYRGLRSGYVLGERSHDGGWSSAEPYFDTLEHLFSAVFALEMVLRLALLRCSFFLSFTNIFDTVVVLATGADTYFFRPLGLTSGNNFSMLRVVRVFRTVVRGFKIIRMARYFEDLRVLIKTIMKSGRALVWFSLLVGPLVGCGGILIADIMVDFIQDDAEDAEMRQWAYTNFGSAARATYSMFEATFSGKWVLAAGPMVRDISPAYALFWIPYVVLVNFTTIAIVRALFMKQTLGAASEDQEMMEIQKAKDKAKISDQLYRFFQETDISGNGLISLAEMKEAMTVPNMMHYLHALELKPAEVLSIFQLLDDGQGEIPFNQFLKTAMQLKGPVRNLTALTILHEQSRMRRRFASLVQLLEGVAGDVAFLSKALARSPAQSERAPKEPGAFSSLLAAAAAQEKQCCGAPGAAGPPQSSAGPVFPQTGAQGGTRPGARGNLPQEDPRVRPSFMRMSL